MALITFDRWTQTARFHNPLHEGQMDEQIIEVRVDPLTGHQSTLNPGLEGKTTTLFPETDEVYLEKRAEETKAQCFLCDGRWKKTTPKYGADFIPEGRLVRGEAVLFPNLFPLAAYHAVVMVGNVHYIPLSELPVSLLEDALSVSIEFIRRCCEKDPETPYFTINANYLSPAGASVIHPHLQILGSPRPGTHHGLLLEKGRDYYGKEGSCYWSDLALEEERNRERFIGKIGRSVWFTAYSPLGVNEVDAVWPGRVRFIDWDDNDVHDAAEGLARVLRSYKELKYSTFNFSCFSGPNHCECPEFCCVLRIVNRQNMVPHHRTDDYYFQKLLKNEIIINRPERLATVIRKLF